MKYAYCGLYTPQAGDKQDEEYPGFVVTEYRKGFFAKQPDLEPRNADGLPSGKVEFRHVFHVENIEERDHWLRCMSGVIARFRTDDRVAQYFFTLTTPPEPKAKSAKNSVATRPEVPKIDPKPNVSATAANFESIAASTSTPDQLSRGLTVKQKVSNLTINDDSKIAQRRNPSSGNVITPGAIIDDQTRCLQQDFPPSLVQELPLKPPGKPVADSGKKKNNFFRDLIKRNTDSSPKQKYNIFGSNLKEATELTRIAPNIDMPAIIYRCIEYLETKNRKFRLII